MPLPTLKEFLHNRHHLALRIASRDLPGLLKKSITIPLNTARIVLFADGASTLAREGEEVSGKFDLILAKRGEIRLRLNLPDLRSSDGLPLAASCGVAVTIVTDRLDLFRDFTRRLFTFPGTFGTEDLKKRLAPEVRRVLADYTATRTAAELHRADHVAGAADLLQSALERHLFDAGMRCEKLLELTFFSEAWERRVSDEKRREEADRRSAEVMDRKEERLRRLAALLEDEQVQDLLGRIPDERSRALLYARLMEDDSVRITAEEFLSSASACGEEVVQVIYKAMENLLSSEASVAPDEIEPARADLIFAAAGHRILEIDPASSGDPVVHEFESSLRSVRFIRTSRGDLLAAGSRQAVSLVRHGEPGGTVESYPLPSGQRVRGGVNAIAATDGFLYATHSEYGLARWNLDRPGEPAELLFEELTRPARTTRAVQIADGRLIFASGAAVFISPRGGEEPPVKFASPAAGPVTCVATASRTLFAGTEKGALVCWKLDEPDQPVVLARKKDPIVSLSLARICGLPHLIYGTRELAVRARVIGQNLETAYESGGPAVGILDAASDLICATDTGGRRLLLWKATAPSEPSRRLDVWKHAERPVLDLWMKKVPA